MIIQCILLLLFLSGVSHTAFAGPIEIKSVQVVPAETKVGSYPEITGSVKANKGLTRGKTKEITVIASVVRPDHVMKSWTWKKVIMRAGDIRSFTIPKEYEIKLAGIYKVDFNIYSKDMLPLHKLSAKFVAVDQSRSPAKTTASEENRARSESATKGEAGRQAENPNFGVGLYVDTLHSSGGATMLLWPFKLVGLQARYAEGSFTITEGRLLARFPLYKGVNPYLGVGYLNVTTERSVELIGLKTRFQDSGVSGVIGAEILMNKSLFGYIEINGSSIDLRKEVSSGAISGTATVAYASATIGMGIVYYLF